MNTPYTYMFIRTDLTVPQQIVQASHAALQAGAKFGLHSHLVLIGVKDQDRLHHVAKMLDERDILFEMFHEPDNNAGYTALCTQPLTGEARRPLRQFQLYNPT